MTSPTLKATESLLHSRRRRVPVLASAIGPAAPPYPRATAGSDPRGAARGQQASEPGGAHDGASGGTSPILVAGRNPAERAMLLEELIKTMPQSTVFEEASAFSEVLEHAPRSRMVILSGDLPDIPAESLTRVLGRRHPRLPIMRLGAQASEQGLLAGA